MTVKLSTVSKLDGIKSWSLQAVTTCPGSRGPDGDLVEVCQGCYATDGNYRFRSVRALRAHNQEDWKRPEWVGGMVDALSNERYFRWFDSGDLYHYLLAAKIHDVIRQTPWCQHWIPTRSHKIPHIRVALEMIDREPNAVVRYSSDFVNQFNAALHGSVVVTEDAVPEGITVCKAYTRTPAKCDSCRACWSKDVATIGYVAHGRPMKKVLAA